MATLAQKIAFLSDPHAYPHHPPAVKAVETHMSWVFLAGDRVFKFKKPVRFPFLDFTTLAARQANCAEELRLNRRLAADIYLRKVPLTEAPDGSLAIGGTGKTVEWLVEMKRLPSESMLDHRLESGQVSREDVSAVARTLADFYANATPQIADGRLYLAHLQQEQAVNRKLLLRKDFGLAGQALPLLDAADELLAGLRPEIEARIASGQVVEGHGDLRPEHIYLDGPVHIIDCLEFDRSMRILDPYDEVSYLGLECAFLGADWIRPVLLDTLEQTIGARPPDRLMALYGTFRCLLRARICMAHLLDDRPLTPEKWPGRARTYLRLGAAELLRARPPADGGSTPRHAGA